MIIRWTIGCVLPTGFDILRESVRAMMLLYGNRFDYCVCYNGVPERRLSFLPAKINLYEQNESKKPFSGDKEFGGSAWKFCPPRLDINTHELFIDNDVIVRRPLDEIDLFAESNKTLICEDVSRYFGRYDHLFPADVTINSGLAGVPPGFDLTAKLHENWEKHGSFQGVMGCDEQAMIAYALFNHPFIKVKRGDMVFAPAHHNRTYSGSEKAIHFLEANRFAEHKGWQDYVKFTEKKTLFM